MFIGKCINCGRRVTETDFENKSGYKLDDSTAVCDKCYFIYFSKVRDYLYLHPGSDMKTLHIKTGVRLKLIELFYEEGALEASVQELIDQVKIKQREAQIQQYKNMQRQQTLSELREARDLFKRDEDINKSAPRMRFLDPNDNKRR